MFRRFAKKFLPNRLDWLVSRAVQKKGKNIKVLIGWNRGLGDIALGLYAMVQRIREFAGDAVITFVTRHNLSDGFSMLEGVKVIIDPYWERGQPYKIDPELKKKYDLVIEKPSPTDWVAWQIGKVIPKLKWNKKHESLYERFELPPNCIGVQVSAETGYGFWRNWPKEKWEELFVRLENRPVVLFGFGQEPKFSHKNIIDLRGKTTLFELLSIIKNRLEALIVPDSGISSMLYYLNESFPIRHITLWADPNHGILKQAVLSPNPKLIHRPLIAKNKDLSTLEVDEVLFALQKKTLPILLAGGMGSRLGIKGPKGLFQIAGKTLFQWFCDKLPKQSALAIMTSETNHDETVDYFRKNKFFGLNIYFFQQEMSPLLDEEKKATHVMGPNGNGNVFRAFNKAGLDEVFKKKGFECVSVSYIDNPLSKPLDPKLIEPNVDVVIQCIKREKDDLMGVLVERDGNFTVIEYTELESNKNYDYSYSGQLAFDFSFFCQMSTKDLPIHWVEKKLDGKMVWKGEQFIFDALKYAKSVKPLCVDKKTHYAPIKGPESIEMVYQALVNK